MTSSSNTLVKQNAIKSALKEIKDSQSNPKPPSHRSIAKKYGIPETTLRRAIENDGPLDRPGPAKVLTDYKEEQLVGYCLNMQRLGFGLTRSGVNQCVMDIIRQNNQPHPFRECGPGQSWWERFMRDHSELSFRVPQALNEARAQRANPIIVKDHFKKLQEIIESHSLTADRIWNMVFFMFYCFLPFFF
jgi:hypothetical protein